MNVNEGVTLPVPIGPSEELVLKVGNGVDVDDGSGIDVVAPMAELVSEVGLPVPVGP